MPYYTRYVSTKQRKDETHKIFLTMPYTHSKIDVYSGVARVGGLGPTCRAALSWRRQIAY